MAFLTMNFKSIHFPYEPVIHSDLKIFLPFPGAFPVRYVFAIVSSFGFFFVYAMRVNLHVALVAMTRMVSHVQDMENIACRELLPSLPENFTLHSNGTTTVSKTRKFVIVLELFFILQLILGFVFSKYPI